MQHRQGPTPLQKSQVQALPQADNVGDRRQDSRLPAHQHVAIHFRSVHLICDLVDLSENGAKVCVLDGMVPNEGDVVALTLFDGTTIEGRVSDLRNKFVAIAFALPISEVSERLDFENLGRAYFGKAVALQKSARG